MKAALGILSLGDSSVAAVSFITAPPDEQILCAPVLLIRSKLQKHGVMDFGVDLL